MTKIAVIMGSSSDWETLRHAVEIIDGFGVACDALVVSAHRTPELMFQFAQTAEAQGYSLIIAGAGGAAHLPGMVASLTPLPVLAVPVQSKTLSGIDSLLSIVQMPAGVPTATFAIGAAGATNAALFAMRMLSLADPQLRQKLDAYRSENAKKSISSTAQLDRSPTRAKAGKRQRRLLPAKRKP